MEGPIEERSTKPVSHAYPEGPIDVTIIVPVYNEQENVTPLYHEIVAVMDAQEERGIQYEVIFIDDGSADRTLPNLYEATSRDGRVTIVEFMRNFGQTAATAAGIDRARGWVIVPIDGDGQNDPADIPMLVDKLEESSGYDRPWDIVSGWRKNRKDESGRKFVSRVANRLVKKLTWTDEIHDFGCSMKAYRATVIKDVRLYGEMHRFLPAVCKWRGARVTEVEVNHRARTAGVSKYGMKRTFKVLLDLCTIKFLGDYLTKPIYFFGKLAAILMMVSFLSLGVALIQKFPMFSFMTEHGQPVSLNRSIFVLFAMMTFLMSVMFVMMGVMSELMVRIYHESQGKRPYKARCYTCGSPGGPVRSWPEVGSIIPSRRAADAQRGVGPVASPRLSPADRRQSDSMPETVTGDSISKAG